MEWVKSMKKKLLSTTYLREAEKYRIAFFLDDKDYYISCKRLIHVTDPFIIHHDIVAMDDGFYILEIVPKNDHYALRIFFNEKKEIVEYYFDIIKDSGLENGVPYFNDLYLDITLLPDGEVNVIDEDELMEAVESEDITYNDYQLVLSMKEKLLKQIEDKSHPLFQIDYSKYLKGLDD